jgi:hypothetical protein
MEKMTFTTDRTALDEGEIITVSWDCHEAERVELTIDNGYKATPIALDLAGSKRFRLNRSKGRTRLTVTAWVGGKSYSKTIKVRVRPMPTTHAETVDDSGRRVGQGPRLTERIGAWWRRRRAAYNERMQALPPDKRLATRTVNLLCGAMLLMLLHPLLGLLGIVGVAGWLMWFIYRR